MKNICKIVLLSAGIFYSTFSPGQRAETIQLGALQKLMAVESGKIHVINFWATWCGPCVEELPLFEKLATERADVDVTLVSLDLDLDPNPEKVYRFISRKKIQSRVVLLDEPDPNLWISKIDNQWSGALPATIIINHRTGKRKFIGAALKEGELEKYIDTLQ